ncbi:MAG TPA: class I SAM-dependent methyltransferase [Trebonia sp.]|jgi:SAM-dependent methyltransferase|nr:class I SAM-dependent methyltransferase [Trebonia sp.]
MTSQAGYEERAGYYAAEISHVPVPALLAGLLRPGLAVAEMPSGTGHFLPAYSAAGAGITLVDACPQMLAAAQVVAAKSGIAITAVCGAIEDLPGRASTFDLIVMPNGALNQMAADIPLARLLASVARFLAPHGLFLAQFLAPGAGCGFYDPGLTDGDWHQDRQFADEDGHLITRRRRQHHQDGLVHVGFEWASGANPVHCQQVTLRPMPIADVQVALADAGLRTLRTGSGGFAEILGVRQSRRPW